MPSDIVSFDAGWLLEVLLLTVRLGIVLAALPILSAARVPRQVRALFVLSIGVALYGVLGAGVSFVSMGVLDLILAFACEVLIGAFMAFGLQCAFGIFLVAGRVLDMQMGFGVANLLDPISRTQVPLLGVLLELGGVLFFVLAGGVEVLLRIVAYSFSVVPAGSLPGVFDLRMVLAPFGAMFVGGIALVWPAILGLLVLDVVFAIASRMIPQANIFMLSMPVKVLVGLSMLAASLPLMRPIVESVFSAMFNRFAQVLAQ